MGLTSQSRDVEQLQQVSLQQMGETSMADNLKAASLSWALSHVRRFGDTDIFPVPFEYDALAHHWNAIGPLLEAADLSKYKLHSDRRVMALKPGGGFRAATQLDPMDQLIYTAAIYESAEQIEAARIPADQHVACSYRIRLTPQGAFFTSENGWKDFHGRSKGLADSGEFSYVLIADISDFYNQLGQHRIQNGMELAAVPLQRTRNIEAFLNQLTAKQSQGLPVGPFASIILAEVCLTDVDNFLLRQGVRHTRYVDDFRIFCKSRREAIEARHSLTEYLFEVHRLSLESSKSSVVYIEKFIAEELSDPEELEQQAKVDRVNQIFQEVADSNGPYWFNELESDVETALLTQAEEESFVELFEQCLKRPPLHLGLSRHLLRKALKARMTAIIDLVCDNLEVLAPVLRDVVRYLSKTIPNGQGLERGQQLLRFCKESAVGSLPFVRMWILDLLFQRPDLCKAAEAIALSEESERISHHLGSRSTALLAKVHGQIDWVRSRKETWRNYEPWSRRALIWSTSILPTGEKRPFLTMVAEQGDAMDAAVARYLLSGNI